MPLPLKQSAIDALDLQLLSALQADASQTNLELAQSLGLSTATCLRRVKRLWQMGLIERQVTLLNPNRLAAIRGWGITALVEVHLDDPTESACAYFERLIQQEASVEQCYRVSPGADFMVVVHCRDMPDYLVLHQRLFTHANGVRQTKPFFSLRRSKFLPKIPLVWT